MTSVAADLRSAILWLLSKYHAAAFPAKPFIPGVTPVPVHGSVLDSSDLTCLVDSTLDMWLTGGLVTGEFERSIADFVGVREATFCNSGSSANLLAVSSLMSPKLPGHLTKGDEVITVAAAFPTTVNPIIQNGLIPVFVDVSLPTYNVDVSQLEAALSDRTRAIVLSHTLGNPFDIEAVSAFALEHDLWLIEDCCDAFGSTYRGRQVGRFGDLATLSFYPAHQITTGEGGAVMSSSAMKTIVESFRDWGRDCWCEAGKDNTCGKRFGWQMGSLPYGYDHKYSFSHIGYSLKATELQAALGLSQIGKLPQFVDARRHNFRLLADGLLDLDEFFILPEATRLSDPCWFGFPLTVRNGVRRDHVVSRLEAAKIGTRMLFAGNLTRQPAYADVPWRAVGELSVTDQIMNDSFWIGVFPGINETMIEYVIDVFHQVCEGL